MNRLFQGIRRVLDRYEARALEVSEFTALLALRCESIPEREQLLERLRALDSAEPSPLAAARGVHQVRFSVLERAKLAASEAGPDFPFGPLLFSLVHDGDPEDVLHELFERCSESLDRVLAHCANYPGGNDRLACVRQLMAAQVPNLHFVRATDASRAEVLRALELRRRFVDFVIHQQRTTDQELWRAFDQFRRGSWPDPPSPSKSKSGSVRARARASARPSASVPANDTLGARLDYGVPLLRPFERAIPGELYWMRRLTELARARTRRELRSLTAPASRTDQALLLRATFCVRSDLPAELQHGVFVPGSRYAAWLRVALGSTGIDAAVHDSPDLAIKLERVDALGHLVETGLPESSATACQDFVLSRQPAFFVRDVRDYTVLRSICDTRDERTRARRMTVFALRRPREAFLLARRSLRRQVRPLEAEYHSATAFALGPQLAVKYCVRPAPRRPGASAAPAGETLQLRLDPTHGEPLALEFYAILPTRDVLPVEDLRVDWESAGAQRALIARIDIEPQDARTAERLRVAESLTFTAWHTLEAHRPLGGLNRARLELDRASTEPAAAISSDALSEAAGTPRDGAASSPAAPLAERPSAERRTRLPSVRASAEWRSSIPQSRMRSSVPPPDRLRTPTSLRAPARRKRNRSVH